MITPPIVQHVAQWLLQKSFSFQGIGVSIPLVDEVRHLRALLPAAKSSLIFFDVGANKGQYAEAVLEIFPNNTQVHCFEPSQHTFSVLQQNITTLAGSERIIANHIGLSSKCGSATLHYDRAGSGLASLTKRRLDHFSISFDESEEVTLTTLEKYCKECAITQIDVLKVDAEGHELAIFEGARKLFEQNKIQMVQFEFGGCNIDSKTYLQDFYYFFKEFNMSLYRMCRYGKLYPLNGYKESYEVPIYQNFVVLNRDVFLSL